MGSILDDADWRTCPNCGDTAILDISDPSDTLCYDCDFAKSKKERVGKILTREEVDEFEDYARNSHRPFTCWDIIDLIATIKHLMGDVPRSGL